MRFSFVSFQSFWSLSVTCFHVVLGLLAPWLPDTYISHAVLIPPLNRSMCPYQRSLLSLGIRSRSSLLRSVRSSFDLEVATSSGLTLQICLIIALSSRCRWWRFGQGWPVPSFNSMEYCTPHKSAVHMTPFLVWKVAILVWLQCHIHHVVCHQLVSRFPGIIYNLCPMSGVSARCISCAPTSCSLCRRCCFFLLPCSRQHRGPCLSSGEDPDQYSNSWSSSSLHSLSDPFSPYIQFFTFENFCINHLGSLQWLMSGYLHKVYYRHHESVAELFLQLDASINIDDQFL